jgi:hypothetical protein
MSTLEFTAEECEEIIPAAVKAISDGWDLLARALSCAFVGGYWKADDSWKAYCERTMGLRREFPKIIRDLLIVAMTETGVSGPRVADALSVNQSTVSRVAAAGSSSSSFTMGTDGKRYERKEYEAPAISPAKAARIAAVEVIRDLYKVTDKLSRFEPKSKEAATTLRTDITLMMTFMESRLAWIDKNWDSLPDLGAAEDPDYS